MIVAMIVAIMIVPIAAAPIAGAAIAAAPVLAAPATPARAAPCVHPATAEAGRTRHPTGTPAAAAAGPSATTGPTSGRGH